MSCKQFSRGTSPIFCLFSCFVKNLFSFQKNLSSQFVTVCVKHLFLKIKRPKVRWTFHPGKRRCLWTFNNRKSQSGFQCEHSQAIKTSYLCPRIDILAQFRGSFTARRVLQAAICVPVCFRGKTVQFISDEKSNVREANSDWNKATHMWCFWKRIFHPSSPICTLARQLNVPSSKRSNLLLSWLRKSLKICHEHNIPVHVNKKQMWSGRAKNSGTELQLWNFSHTDWLPRNKTSRLENVPKLANVPLQCSQIFRVPVIQ